MSPYYITDWQGGLAQAYSGLVYWPSPLEWGVAIGVIALALLVLLAGLKFMPLKPTDDR